MFEILQTKLFQETSSTAVRKQGKPRKNQKVRCAPKTKITFKPTLIEELMQEHEQCFRLLDDSQRYADRNIIEKAREKLVQFKDLLIEHLLKENTSVYIYLRQTESSKEMQEQIQSVKYEMEKVGHRIKHLIDDSVSEDAVSREQFVLNLNEIRKLLRFRVELEELKIYPNYKKC